MSLVNDEKIIFAGIVTYQPEISRLNENIQAVFQQVEKIIIVDNGSENCYEIQRITKNFDNIILILNKKNLGIAKALNQIMEASLEKKADWVLTLDQDSVVSDSLISHYREKLNIPDLGMLSCLLKDRNASGLTLNETHGECEEIEKCFTSGCLLSIVVWNRCGHYDEKMFIDYVDFDMCMLLREHGYKIFRINTIGILHELGHSKDIKILGKNTVVNNHPPKRKYYLIRNWIYYTRKHASVLCSWNEYKSICKYVIKTMLFEPNKIANLTAMIRGALDSREM